MPDGILVMNVLNACTDIVSATDKIVQMITDRPSVFTLSDMKRLQDIQIGLSRLESEMEDRK